MPIICRRSPASKPTLAAVRHAEAVASFEEIGKRDFSANKVVDVAVIDVIEENGKLWPTRLRERIRAAGPTVHYATGFKPADAAFIAV